MIEGKKIKQISKVFVRSPDGHVTGVMIERDHRVVRFKQYLYAGPLPGGGVRQHDIIQFVADPGGLRTINADDIVLPG
jgi:hypothetical protein